MRPDSASDARIVLQAIAEDPVMAWFSVWIVPARALGSEPRTLAAALGPGVVREAQADGSGAVEVIGNSGHGCDPPESWVRIERHGAWLVRIELESYASGEADYRERVERWRTALRELVRPSDLTP
ncbi:hypothetical protein [Sandaracinus amylolyticus]|uniref:hypothetical protein n=1 Tax=Sandaracinus amylolyticus TaxID=927083 RepID=UPI001F220BF3|nr:hypothetical protein [Sandaracinus amylolyticus]